MNSLKGMLDNLDSSNSTKDNSHLSSSDSLRSMLENLNNFDQASSNSNNLPPKCSLFKCFVEPTIFLGGLVANILLIIIIFKNKHTKSLSSSKPMRYLLVGMLVSDVWFLLDQTNVWFFSIVDKPDLSSYNGTCQIYTYLEHFFAISLEFYMLFADYILLVILFKSKKSILSPEEVYNQFMVRDSKNHGDPETEGMLSSKTKVALRKSLSRLKRMLSHDESNFINHACGDEVVDCEAYNLQLSRRKETVDNLSSESDQKSDHNEDVPDLGDIVVDGRKISNFVVVGKSKSLNMHKSSANKARKKNMFYVLLDTTKFKNENIYYNIVIKEKVVIILWIFICMYLLSFLLWIRGDPAEAKRAQLSRNEGTKFKPTKSIIMENIRIDGNST
jgi:hypothetical protein